MAKILISTTSFDRNNQFLKEFCANGNEVIFNPYGRKLMPAELIEIATDAIGIIAGTELIDKDILEKLPRLRVISRCGVGLDNVDLECCKSLGIHVYNTPSAPTLAVAELTIGLMLNLLRGVSLMDRRIRAGGWEKKMGSLLHGKRIGIVGFGRIGRKVHDLLAVFSVQCGYFDVDKSINSNIACFEHLNDLLSWANIISLHCSMNKEKKKVIGEKELKSMNRGSWLINVSRGEVIDEEALFRALSTGHLAGAAIDTFEYEPYLGRLKDLDNVILTPHIGSYAQEARIDMENESVKNIIEGLRRLL